MIHPPSNHSFRPQAARYGLTIQMLQAGLRKTYETIDAIDQTLETRSGLRLANIVELANLSSMIGNVLAQGIVDASAGVFNRAGAHKYQDLRGAKANAENIEIKMALEGNKPKGHLPKAGHYLTCRYVLCDDNGTFKRGKANRGRLPRVWELRLGELKIADFAVSNTAGDSGKTAVVSPDGMKKLRLIYFDQDLCPMARVTRYLAEYGP